MVIQLFAYELSITIVRENSLHYPYLFLDCAFYFPCCEIIVYITLELVTSAAKTVIIIEGKLS